MRRRSKLRAPVVSGLGGAGGGSLALPGLGVLGELALDEEVVRDPDARGSARPPSRGSDVTSAVVGRIVEEASRRSLTRKMKRGPPTSPAACGAVR